MDSGFGSVVRCRGAAAEPSHCSSVSGRRRADPNRPLGPIVILAAAAWIALVTAGAGAEGAPATEREALNLATFDEAWRLVAETHFDPALGGVDWNAVRNELRPRAAAAGTDRELRRVLDDMVSRLGQSHFAILPGTDADSAPETTGGAGPDLPPDCAPDVHGEILAWLETRTAEDGQPGIEVALLDEDQVVVTRVSPAGPAGRLGVAAGWRLLAVEGRTIAGPLDCLAELTGAGFHRQLVKRWLESLLDGPPGAELPLRFERGDGREVEIKVDLEAPPGERVGFGNLPPSLVRFEVAGARTPGGAEVSVVRFNQWLLPIATAFEHAMPELRASDAVVIDVRGNPGGVAVIAQGVAGHFVAEETSLGSLRSRRDDLELVVEPRRVARDGSRVEPHRGPLAILIDEGSASTSEVFAAGLRDHGRARLFGSRSAGAALPAVTDRLPNGDVFLHASMDYIRPNGEPVEGRPIVPDVETALDREDLMAGRDAALVAALAWIDEELARRKPSSHADAGGEKR